MRIFSSTVAVGLSFVASHAAAADYTFIRVDTVVAAPIEKAWARVGPFCAIAVWSPDHAPCKLEGDGDVASVRRMPPNNVVEVLVAKTKHSYTYVQPNKDLIFHGTLAAEAVDKTHTRFIYTAFYDQAAFTTEAAKVAEKKRRVDRWKFQMTRIKAVAEAAK